MAGMEPVSLTDIRAEYRPGDSPRTMAVRLEAAAQAAGLNVHITERTNSDPVLTHNGEKYTAERRQDGSSEFVVAEPLITGQTRP